jgi:hypothetical protein
VHAEEESGQGENIRFCDDDDDGDAIDEYVDATGAVQHGNVTDRVEDELDRVC